MQQPGVNGQSESYRYGFQGQEHDDEVTGSTSHYAYEYRMNDARVGRFLSLDPLSAKYPYNSPYAFSENDLISSVELEGKEKLSLTGGSDDNTNATFPGVRLLPYYDRYYAATGRHWSPMSLDIISKMDQVRNSGDPITSFLANHELNSLISAENEFHKDPDAYYREQARKANYKALVRQHFGPAVSLHPGVWFASDLNTVVRGRASTWDYVRFGLWFLPAPSIQGVRGGVRIGFGTSKFMASFQATLPNMRVFGYEIRGSVFGIGTRLRVGTRTFGLDFHTLPGYGFQLKGINYPVFHLHYGKPNIISIGNHIRFDGPVYAGYKWVNSGFSNKAYISGLKESRILK